MKDRTPTILLIAFFVVAIWMYVSWPARSAQAIIKQAEAKARAAEIEGARNPPKRRVAVSALEPSVNLLTLMNIGDRDKLSWRPSEESLGVYFQVIVTGKNRLMERHTVPPGGTIDFPYSDEITCYQVMVCPNHHPFEQGLQASIMVSKEE
jgi:hypothetical protein